MLCAFNSPVITHRLLLQKQLQMSVWRHSQIRRSQVVSSLRHMPFARRRHRLSGRKYPVAKSMASAWSRMKQCPSLPTDIRLLSRQLPTAKWFFSLQPKMIFQKKVLPIYSSEDNIFYLAATSQSNVRLYVTSNNKEFGVSDGKLYGR